MSEEVEIIEEENNIVFAEAFEDVHEPVEVPAEVMENFNNKKRSQKWEEVKKVRFLKLTEDFEYRDAMFQADENSVRNMQVRLAGLPNGKIITWLDSQNNPHNFSDGDLESMLSIIGDRGDHIYAKSWETKDLIMSIDGPLNFDAVAHFEGLL